MRLDKYSYSHRIITLSHDRFRLNLLFAFVMICFCQPAHFQRLLSASATIDFFKFHTVIMVNLIIKCENQTSIISD